MDKAIGARGWTMLGETGAALSGHILPADDVWLKGYPCEQWWCGEEVPYRA